MINKTKRTTPSRKANARAGWSPEVIYPILDEALFCTISYAEDGQPFSIPQSFVRIDNYLYLHGSVGSRFMRKLADGRPVCISTMLADDLVIAKSAFHHSVNYRSVVTFAEGELIEDNDKKYEAFKMLTEKMVPNSWGYLKPMSIKEVSKTTAVRFSLAESSAKLRQGPPSHDDIDQDLPIWTGLIPIKPLRQKPVPDVYGEKLPLPKHLAY